MPAGDAQTCCRDSFSQVLFKSVKTVYITICTCKGNPTTNNSDLCEYGLRSGFSPPLQLLSLEVDHLNLRLKPRYFINKIGHRSYRKKDTIPPASSSHRNGTWNSTTNESDDKQETTNSPSIYRISGDILKHPETISGS